MSYTIDRLEWAALLNCSTRTIDRYIRSGKIRTKRVGKKVFLHEEDVHIIQWGGVQSDYIVLDAEGKQFPAEPIVDSGFSRRPVMVDYKVLFEDSQKSIARKDELIQDLSYRVGQAEAELKNSISLIEYKKATLLLESSNKKGEEEKQDLTRKVDLLEKRVEKGQTINFILLIALFILLLLSGAFWFVNL